MSQKRQAGKGVNSQIGAKSAVGRGATAADALTSTKVTNAVALPAEWRCIIDAETIARCISRMAHEILERNQHRQKLAVVGIRSAGEFLAKRLHEKLCDLSGEAIGYGVLDITLYRDDVGRARSQQPTGGSQQPILRGTDLKFSVSGSWIILVDDVFYTGRTVRAALDAIIDFGRPARVELAVLADRGHRELPIRPDYVGKNIPTAAHDFVKVRLREQGQEDGVYLIAASDRKRRPALPPSRRQGQER